MGGSDDPSNLVKVTVEQHALLHKQLWEDLKDIRDYYAWKGLSGQNVDKLKLTCSLGGKIGSKKLLGKPKSLEHKKSLSEVNLGKKLSDETKKKLSDALIGNKSPFHKKYEIIDPTGKKYIVDGLNKFCRDNNLSQGNMSEVANGARQQHKGWKCKLL